MAVDTYTAFLTQHLVKENTVLSPMADFRLAAGQNADLFEAFERMEREHIGVHDGNAVVKQILAGPKAVQVVSSLYKNGPEHIRTMQDTLTKWMIDHDHTSLSDFRGKMSQAAACNPAVFDRVQSMKYFS